MRLLVCIPLFTLVLAGQPLPQAVDLVQRVDNLYPWLNVVAFDVDSQGNTYLAGSSSLPIPNVVNIRTGPLGGMDIVVIKVDPSGQLVYGAAIGGTGDEYVGRIKVDSAQNLYLFGTTNSADYPALSWQGVGGNAVILKLDAAGAVHYNTRLGWAGAILAMALDPAGTAYIGGIPNPGELPTTPGAYRQSSTSSGGFVARIDPTGTQVGGCNLRRRGGDERGGARDRRRFVFHGADDREPGWLPFPSDILHSYRCRYQYRQCRNRWFKQHLRCRAGRRSEIRSGWPTGLVGTQLCTRVFFAICSYAIGNCLSDR